MDIFDGVRFFLYKQISLLIFHLDVHCSLLYNVGDCFTGTTQSFHNNTKITCEEIFYESLHPFYVPNNSGAGFFTNNKFFSQKKVAR